MVMVVMMGLIVSDTSKATTSRLATCLLIHYQSSPPHCDVGKPAKTAPLHRNDDGDRKRTHRGGYKWLRRSFPRRYAAGEERCWMDGAGKG
jgi:hypothetical protein